MIYQFNYDLKGKKSGWPFTHYRGVMSTWRRLGGGGYLGLTVFNASSNSPVSIKGDKASKKLGVGVGGIYPV